MNQQDLVNHITTLAASISRAGIEVVDVRYFGELNQLHVSIGRHSSRRQRRDEYVDLSDPGESQLAQARTARRLRELAGKLEAIRQRGTPPPNGAA